MVNMNDIISDLETLDFISCDKCFEYTQICTKYLRNIDKEHEARKIIINILNNWHKIDEGSKEMFTDLIESAGFYPYLEKEKNRVVFRNTAGEIRKEFHRSQNLENKYFHEEQKTHNDILTNEQNLIVSAPTSFGKSLLIEEIVASRKYKNIVIIQPTLALLDETRKKLKKYRLDYKIIIRTSQNYSDEKGNLFLLTAERVMEYPEFPNIDFFVIDEFYKLSAKRDDERSDVLNNAFNLLVNKHKSKFYLLGPNIDGISEGFAKRYNAEYIQTTYSLVDNQEINMASESFGDRGNKKENKEKALFNLLLELKDEQTIIYCSSPQRVRYLSKKFCNYLKEKNVEPQDEELSIIEWIKENVSKKWSLIDHLNHGIGIHDGALQKHITSSIINYFNNNKLRYLFCTSTIIEGVNTSAKNVVYFDKKKGGKPIDFFDYCNIKGRSGRMMIHYIGKIYNFNSPPPKENVVVDIPFFEQKPVSDEILIHINEIDIRNKESEQYKKLKEIPENERELFRRNGIKIEGQKRILEKLKQDINNNHGNLCWNRSPKYSQLAYILSLGWDNLLKTGETTSPMTKARLIKVTFDYGINQDISKLVDSIYLYNKKLTKYESVTDEEIFDDAVKEAFQILKHWFHYKVPKWLNVINELQKYVCTKRGLESGDYSYYASQIENDFVRGNLSILIEYGIPKSAINKLMENISPDLNDDLVIEQLKNEKIIEASKLIDYEKEKIEENL